MLQAPLRLIDVQSPTAKAVSAILEPLEDAAHVHVALNCETGEVDVHLPRLSLDFFLKAGTDRLESKQFRGMSVDADQSFSTMTGLVNRLVLRSNRGSSRSVIIPYGDVHFEKDEDHVRVRIIASTRHVSYHYYRIDHQLGRLIDSGSLKSQLFKTYLHALTAHCLTDGLTGRTGTEEALSTLASASVRSFSRLERGEINLLVLLARLTPCRRYYPQHVQAMQQVDWADLSPLSQHEFFEVLVRSIFEQARTLDLFYENPTDLPSTDTRGVRDLLERAAIRNATFRVDEFGAEVHTVQHDVLYDSRDHVSNSVTESNVFRVARLVESWSQDLSPCRHLLEEIESWKGPVHGRRTKGNLSLGYYLKWLDPPAECLPKEWCTLQTALSLSKKERDKYKIMILLSTLACSQHAKPELVQTLLAYATVPGLRAMRPPKFESLRLSEGHWPDREKLLVVMEEAVWPYNACPESSLAKLPFETPAEADARRQERYQAVTGEQLGLFVNALASQWPTASVSKPSGGRFDIYISVKAATKAAQPYFHTWHRNAEFRSYVRRSQDMLDNLSTNQPDVHRYSFSLPGYSCVPKSTHVGLKTIFEAPAPSLSPISCVSLDHWIYRWNEVPEANGRLKLLLKHLSLEAQDKYHKQYAFDLRESFESHHGALSLELRGSLEELASCLEDNVSRCKRRVKESYGAICRSLEAEVPAAVKLSCMAGLWPRLSKISLFGLLAHGAAGSLRSCWKAALINFGLMVTEQQRAERLLAQVGDDLGLLSELSNSGHQEWNPLDHPEWLLLEIENNILIRPAQARMAIEMISPSSDANSLLQMNMGEGKSSVIVPMVAAALANGEARRPTESARLADAGVAFGASGYP